MKKSLLVMAIVLAVAAPSFANHSWGGYHWARKANPFTLKVGNNLTTSDWSGHLSQANSDWNAGNTPVHSTVVSGTSNSNCAMVAGTIQVCNKSYGSNGWLGLASINLQSGTKHITQGTAKMNDTYFNTSTYNNKNEREHVMCQEVAHVFGLDHQSTDGSSLNTCMDYFSNTGSNAGSTASTKPNSHDYSELKTIYNHLDSSNTYSSISFTGDRSENFYLPEEEDTANWDSPAQWGEVIDATMDGRTTTYARELSNGDVVVTCVYWAHEADRGHAMPGDNQ